MFGLGIQELLIILVMVVMIFGAGRLPKIGSVLGQGIHNFRQSIGTGDRNATASLIF